MSTIPDTRSTTSAPPAPLPQPKPRPRPIARPGEQAALVACLVAETSQYSDVALESVSYRGVLHTIRVWLDGEAEHIPSNQECPSAYYRGTCHHMRDARLVADAYQAYLTLVAQEREWQERSWSFDAATRSADEQRWLRARDAAVAAGYALQRPEGTQ